MISRICPICNKTYYADPARLKIGRQTTCSRQCSYKLRGQKSQNDLTGQKFGKWTVLGVSDKKTKTRAKYYICQCSCGTTKEVFCSSLLRGSSLSCGCNGGRKSILPYRKTPEYQVWKKIKDRCCKPSNPAYGYYGGRGIDLCDRWKNFENFYHDMGPRPSPEYSIERLDNNKSYSPENCVWVTRLEQANNRRNNILLTHNGRTLTVSQWAREVGIKYPTLLKRIKNGWPDDLALTTPVRNSISR